MLNIVRRPIIPLECVVKQLQHLYTPLLWYCIAGWYFESGVYLMHALSCMVPVEESTEGIQQPLEWFGCEGKNIFRLPEKAVLLGTTASLIAAAVTSSNMDRVA